MDEALKDIKIEDLSNKELLGIAEALDSFIFKQQIGEPYHKNYKKDKESFKLLVKQTAAFKRKLKSYFLDLKDKLPQLVEINRIIAAEEDFFNIGEWDVAEGDLAGIIGDGIMPIYTNGARTTAKDLGAATNIDADSAPSQKFIRKHSLDLADDITTETKSRIKEAIKTSLDLGEKRGDLANRLDDIIDNDYRATMIAQTESIRAYSEGRLEVGKELGYQQKQWKWPGFSNCKICPDLEDQGPIGIDESWDTGSDSLGLVDTTPAHPNCQCSIDILKGEEDIEAKEYSPQAIIGNDGKIIKAGWITINGNHIFLKDDVPDTVISETASHGGATISLKGKMPTSGYAVSPYLKAEEKVDKKDLNTDKVKEYISKHGELAKVDHYIGAWYNESDGKVYLDVSVVKPDAADAIKIARGANQLAIYNIGKGETIDQKDYVKYAKEEKNISRYQDNDPRGDSEKDSGAYTLAEKALIKVNEFLESIKGGWVTINGNHVFIPDSPEDVVSNSTGKSMGQIQREHEAAIGLGPLTSFQDAMNSRDYQKAERVLKVIQKAPDSSPLAAYKNTATDLFKTSRQGSIGREAFDLNKFKDLSQDKLNTKVETEFAKQFPKESVVIEDYNFKIKEIPLTSIAENVAGSPGKVEKFVGDMLKGDKFPPVMILHFNGTNILPDGAHRVEAVREIGAKQITVLYGTPK